MSLAVAEKRPQQRNGGCVGILLQIFSKKKLFSKKLLPPPPPPAAKFAGDDKMHMARFMLIAEENRRGFPKAEPGPGPDLEGRMQSPGIVARLMGLESMPVVSSEKPRKALDSEFCGESRFEHARLDQELFVDSARSSKTESRPLKLQKTRGRFLERRPVEIFQKGLIYGRKKKQYMKLDSPLKSPRLLTRGSTSRLVQVANRILEPGLQSRSQAKCAITYIDFSEQDRKGGGEVLRDLTAGSCNSCGNSVGAKGSSATECVSSGSELSYGSEDRKKVTTPMSGQRKNGPVSIQSNLKAKEVYKMKEPVVASRQAKINVSSINHELMKREKHLVSSGDQYGRSVIGKNSSSQRQLSPVKDRVVTRTKICNEEKSERSLNELHRAKNFVAMNKNINNYTRSRSPTKVSVGCRVELERDGSERSLTHTKSPANRKMEAFGTNRRVRKDAVSRKERGHVNSESVNHSCIKSNLGKINRDSFTSNDNNGIVSFAFSSPMRRDSRSRTNEEIAREIRNQGELNGDAFHSKKLIPDAKIGRLSSHEGLALRGDELSNLLEEKIRELTSLDHNELTSADDLQGRSTVSILEDLISALTTGTAESRKKDDRCSEASTLKEISMSYNQLVNVEEGCQEKAQSGNCVSCLAGVTDQPSPVSILEASFSNDSYSLGSVNGSSGNKTQPNVQKMCNGLLDSDMDSELIDSATSLSTSRSVNGTSSICKVGVSETKLGTAGEAISDAELLFENLSLYGSDRTSESSLDPFLLDVLESITDAFSLNFEPAKDVSQPREFLFDCIMECLDAKFSHFCRSGFRTWLKLPLIMDRDRMMRDFHVQIREWWDLAGKAMDVLVEKDMDGSDLKWTACEAEAFGTGVEIQSDILQALIDEVVIDLR